MWDLRDNFTDKLLLRWTLFSPCLAILTNGAAPKLCFQERLTQQSLLSTVHLDSLILGLVFRGARGRIKATSQECLFLDLCL